MRMQFVTIVALLTCSLLASTGCSVSTSHHPEPPTILASASDAEVVERVLEFVPVGTSIESAKEILTQAGLSPKIVESESGNTYIAAGFSDKRDFWVTWVWDIRLETENGAVTKVTCKTAGVGM